MKDMSKVTGTEAMNGSIRGLGKGADNKCAHVNDIGRYPAPGSVYCSDLLLVR